MGYKNIEGELRINDEKVATEDYVQSLVASGGSGVKNIQDGANTGSLQQIADGVENGFSFSSATNAAAVDHDSTLNGTVPYGGQEEYAAAFGGKSSAQGRRSFASGSSTVAKGKYSHVEGSNGVAFGTSSHVEGAVGTAIGDYSHVEGSNGVAKGTSSHVEGMTNTVEGNGGHGEGWNNTVKGNYAHGEGSNNIVGEKAHSAHVSGQNNYVNYEAQAVFGRYNKNKPNNVLEVGWGDGDAASQRKNVFEVDKDGEAYAGGVRLLKEGEAGGSTDIEPAYTYTINMSSVDYYPDDEQSWRHFRFICSGSTPLTDKSKIVEYLYNNGYTSIETAAPVIYSDSNGYLFSAKLLSVYATSSTTLYATREQGADGFRLTWYESSTSITPMRLVSGLLASTGSSGSVGEQDIKNALISGSLEWSDTDKAAACEKIGAVTKKQVYPDNDIVYGRASQRYNFEEKVFLMSYNPSWGALLICGDYNTIGQTDPGTSGGIICREPIHPYQVANKKYVDDNFANMAATLVGDLSANNIPFWDGEKFKPLVGLKTYSDGKQVYMEETAGKKLALQDNQIYLEDTITNTANPVKAHLSASGGLTLSNSKQRIIYGYDYIGVDESAGPTFNDYDWQNRKTFRWPAKSGTLALAQDNPERSSWQLLKSVKNKRPSGASYYYTADYYQNISSSTKQMIVLDIIVDSPATLSANPVGAIVMSLGRWNSPAIPLHTIMADMGWGKTLQDFPLLSAESASWIVIKGTGTGMSSFQFNDSGFVVPQMYDAISLSNQATLWGMGVQFSDANANSSLTVKGQRYKVVLLNSL